MSATQTSLGELALLFLRLGATAFGGPAAHIAMMRDEVVTRRGWIDEAHFLDMLSAANLIPGPNSTELAIHIGWARRRWAGLLVAGVCFIVPAMLITGACGWAYVRYGTRPEAGWLLYGVKPVILAVIAQALWGLAPKALHTPWLRVLGAVLLVLGVLGAHELLLLLAAGLLTVLVTRRLQPERDPPAPAEADRKRQVALPLLSLTAASASLPVALPALFWVFFKTGAVLFGSGYVLIAFLRADLVERLHWLSEAQLLDAIAIGQITPGPVFTTATFIGYLLAGPHGAWVATLGIFLPAFVFVALSGPLVPRLRASRTAGRFLDGVNVASLVLMAVAACQLARAALVDVPAVALALLSALLLMRFHVGSTALIVLGAIGGWLLRGL